MAILRDYKCNYCRNTFEEFSKDNLIECPNCHSFDIKRLLSAPAQLNTNGADKNSHRTSKYRNLK